MLVLGRKTGGSIIIDDTITLTVVEIHDNGVVTLNLKRDGGLLSKALYPNGKEMTKMTGQRFKICKNVHITIRQNDSYGDVRLGIEAPRNIEIWRSELYAKNKRQERITA